jgi:urease accessory protein
MQARACVEARHERGETRLVTLRSEAPLLLRRTPGGVHLVGGAAGPLGGDDLALDIDVGDRASLVVRSAAATLAQPGPRGGSSLLRTTLRVGDDGALVMHPEPLVSVVGSHHVMDTGVALGRHATLHLVEELVLGRHDEPPGRVRTRTRLEREGVALLTHELDVGTGAPGWPSAAVIGAARAVVQHVVVGPDAPSRPLVLRDDVQGCHAAWLPFSPHAAVLLALAPTLLEARRAADRLAATTTAAASGPATACRSGAPSR